MPTYDYVCDACGHEFEEFQSITAEPLKKCPECGKSKLKRLLGTGGGIIFKGGGFYQTDYRSESYKKAAADETKAVKGDSSAAASGGKESASAAPSTDGAKADKTAAPAPAKKSASKKPKSE